MAGDPDQYRFQPGEVIKWYNWTEEEILAAKAFLIEQDSPLWEDLKAIEQDAELETFGGTDPYIRSIRLLKMLHPEWDVRQTCNLWGRLRSLWRAELVSTNRT